MNFVFRHSDVSAFIRLNAQSTFEGAFRLIELNVIDAKGTN